MPNTHKVDLIGQEVVAAHLGVTSQAISNWYKREAEAVENDGAPWRMPVPTLVQYRPGKKPTKVWRRAQLSVWKKWHDAHMAERGKNIPVRGLYWPADLVPPTTEEEDSGVTGSGGNNEPATEGASPAEAHGNDDTAAQGSVRTDDRELSVVSA